MAEEGEYKVKFLDGTEDEEELVSKHRFSWKNVRRSHTLPSVRDCIEEMDCAGRKGSCHLRERLHLRRYFAIWSTYFKTSVMFFC